MSLTSHLDDTGSPVRAYLDGISPWAAHRLSDSTAAHTTAGSLTLVQLAKREPIVPCPLTIDAPRTGTAFDIRTRMALGGFDVDTSTSAAGVRRLPLLDGLVDNGAHRARILTEAYEVAAALTRAPSREVDLDRAAMVLAHCEQLIRAGSSVFAGSLGAACDRVSSGREFVDNIDPLALSDLRMLVESNAGQVRQWNERIAAGARFEPNPGFRGAVLVGGADGDWLIGDTLIDCKVYATLSVSTLRDFLRQLLGYVMLDLDDALQIRHVGVWLPRQGLMPTWSLAQLLGDVPEAVLPSLREGFVRAASGDQLAVRVPVTERRMRHLVADNRHARPYMLNDLADHPEQETRFRVARNPATPEATVRKLATDRYARVRQGVAMNKNAPADVLRTLAQDSSVMVQRAVAANPRTGPGFGRAELSRGYSDDPQTIDEDGLPVRSNELDGTEQARVEPTTSVPDKVSARIDRRRPDWVLDEMWLWRFLGLLVREEPGSTDSTLFLLPRATLMSGTSNRHLDMLEHLPAVLPDEVKIDLMQPTRPAWVRQLVAESLPMDEPAVRAALLADPDPEIRWSALQRSTDYFDDTIVELLTNLAGSRQARLRFRIDNDVTPRWARAYTPAEYDEEMLEVIAGHPSTPRSALHSLLEHKSPRVLIALAQNPALTTDGLTTLIHTMKATKSTASREWFAESAGTPAEVLESLASARRPSLRHAAARNHATPLTALTTLAVDPDPSARTGVVENSSTPGELATSVALSLLLDAADHELLELLETVKRRTDLAIPTRVIEDALERLSKSRVREPDMRAEVAEDDRTSGKTLTRLARSTDDDVRRAVAGNLRTPVTAMGILANDPVAAVRAAVAGNETSTESVLNELSRDEEPDVRLRAARNPNTPEDALRILLVDPDHRVGSAALKNPSTHPADLFKAAIESDVDTLDPQWTQEQMREMAAHKRAEVRIRVARAPETPPDILNFLGGERRSAQVRRAVAANPNTPSATLWSMANDNDLEVHQALAFNEAAPPDLLAHLAGQSIDLALMVSLNPGTPPEVVEVLANDSEALVRYTADAAQANRALYSGRAQRALPPATDTY